MDVFLDVTGTITDMESENRAFLRMCEAIARRFKINMSGEELMRHILNFRKPYMDSRDKVYYPIRNLIVMAVQEVLPFQLSPHDAFWIVDAYSAYHARYVRMVDGGMDALKEIRGMAEHLGVITDADRPYTEKVLNSLGLADFFDSVTTAEDAGVGKPNPRIFQMALRNSKTTPKVYVGDSEKRDVVGAKNAGMIAVKVGGKSPLADYSVPSLAHVPGIQRSIL